MRSTTGLLLGLALLATICHPADAAKKKKGPKVTTKVYFDVTIGGKEAGWGEHTTVVHRLGRFGGGGCPGEPRGHRRARCMLPRP